MIPAHEVVALGHEVLPPGHEVVVPGHEVLSPGREVEVLVLAGDPCRQLGAPATRQTTHIMVLRKKTLHSGAQDDARIDLGRCPWRNARSPRSFARSCCWQALYS